MKIYVHLKDPDALFEGQQDALKKEKTKLIDSGLSDEEAEEIASLRVDKAKEFISQFVEYDEYYHIEFDTETQTVQVIPVKG